MMSSFQKIIDSLFGFGGSSENESATAPSTPPSTPARSFVQKFLAYKANSVPATDEEEKKQTKRRRKDQNNMSKEKPSPPVSPPPTRPLAFTEVEVEAPPGLLGFGLAEPGPNVITIARIEAKCVIKGQVQVGDQLIGIDGNAILSTLEEVAEILNTKRFNPIRRLTFKGRRVPSLITTSDSNRRIRTSTSLMDVAWFEKDLWDNLKEMYDNYIEGPVADEGVTIKPMHGYICSAVGAAVKQNTDDWMIQKSDGKTNHKTLAYLPTTIVCALFFHDGTFSVEDVQKLFGCTDNSNALRNCLRNLVQVKILIKDRVERRRHYYRLHNEFRKLVLFQIKPEFRVSSPIPGNKQQQPILPLKFRQRCLNVRSKKNSGVLVTV